MPTRPARRSAVPAATSLPAAQSGVDSIAVDLPLQFDLFELASTGRYTFLLHIDGEAVGAAQLNVRQVNTA